MSALHERYPELAQRLIASQLAKTVEVVKAQDGGVAFAISGPGGRQFLTNPADPVRHIQSQLDSAAVALQDSTRPILVVGLYPGNELILAFDLAERIATPHCPQPIWVCIDSILCLRGFLKCWDVRHILKSDRVTLFWHTEIPRRTSYLREHPEFPHTFTLLSGAPEDTLNRLLPPFAQLVVERDEAVRQMSAANDLYYNGITDEQLASIVAGKSDRKPRLLMPTCKWSTFIQHSTRDTCAAFRDLGWETRILDLDALLTPYHLVKTIHDFRPDVLLFIDHMRYEAEAAYPRNLMFVTWIQDDMAHLQCRRAGEMMASYAARGRRDLVAGYVDSLDVKYGYPKDRLVPIFIPADPRVFHPVELTDADRASYECDLAFMSNVSTPSEQVVERTILPAVEPLGISRSTCMQVHDDLWKFYRAGKTLSDRNEFLTWLLQYPEFAEVWRKEQESNDGSDDVESHVESPSSRVSGFESPVSDPSSPASSVQSAIGNRQSTIQDNLFRLFYWRLNDTIYRHVVLEWAVELAEGDSRQSSVISHQSDHSPLFTDQCSLITGPSPFRLHLYGQGWENHPRFAKYACGPLAHGPELNMAYQAAGRCLHLNITQGMHQRLWEVTASGGHPLVRATQTPRIQRLPSNAVMAQIAQSVLRGQNVEEIIDTIRGDPECESVVDWVFSIAFATAQKVPAGTSSGSLTQQVSEEIERLVLSRPEWVLGDWPSCHFLGKSDFIARLLS